jgi:hypothetical protein
VSVKKALARKAAKATVRHSAHGAASKLRRDRVRTATVFGFGVAIGALAGWMAGRAVASSVD